MANDIRKPKWIKGFNEIPFSKRTQITDEGEEIEFDPSDEGKFVRDLYSQLTFEILICDLPKKQREAVRLRCEGLSRKEIAEEMGVKPNAVKMLIFRAYKQMREKFKQYET